MCRARSTVPIRLARRPISARSEISASAPGACPDDDDAPADGERLEAGREIGRADELEHDVHAAGLREAGTARRRGRERVAVRAAVGEHARAGGDAELDGGGADAARRAVHEERLSHARGRRA